MADEGGEAEAPPPPAGSEETPAAAEADDANADDLAETAAKIESLQRVKRSHSRSQSQLRFSQPRLSTVSTGERVDVDRAALEAILDVSARIQDMQKKSKVSMSMLAMAHESYKDKQVNKDLI